MTEDEQKLAAHRAIDKLGRLGPPAVLRLLTIGRKDGSGNFTEGAGLSLSKALFIMDSIGQTQLREMFDLFVEIQAKESK